jgi:hypothetical protein
MSKGTSQQIGSQTAYNQLSWTGYGFRLLARKITIVVLAE